MKPNREQNTRSVTVEVYDPGWGSEPSKVTIKRHDGAIIWEAYSQPNELDKVAIRVSINDWMYDGDLRIIV
jgi:hypothetical protein